MAGRGHMDVRSELWGWGWGVESERIEIEEASKE